MPKRPTPEASAIYQLKITLLGSKPPIWRRVQVTETTTLHQLHWIIQLTMGWTNSHLHQFEIGGVRYSQRDFGLEEVKDERRITLKVVIPGVVLGGKYRFIYEYDFGDGWEHEVTVEKRLAPEQEAHYPRCVAGKRACPPEDCGGVWGYEHFLEVINDEDDPEHEERLEWAGGSFDPEAFSVEEVNEALREEFR